MGNRDLASALIWDKGGVVEQGVIDFTAGRDRLLDKRIASWDIVGSIAHAIMLRESGIITADDCEEISTALEELLCRATEGDYEPGDRYEDIHSRIEADLISLAGDVGKRLHAGRSRNDQVLTSIYLYLRHEIGLIAGNVGSLLRLIAGKGERYSRVMMPGYTHLQPAMPSTFALWMGSYAESLSDDLLSLSHASEMINASPAGTAAGYGTSLPLRREVAASLLQFDRLVICSPYAQLRRGKAEKEVADAIASVAYTLSRLAGDIILFLSQEFSFITLDKRLTTGSSIMPQKSNPDLAELIRARSNMLRAQPTTLSMVVTNLPSGYNRDYQVLKELLFPAVEEIKELLAATELLINGISVREDIVDERYDMIFAAEAANRLVMEGIPFRDAYRQIAGDAQGSLRCDFSINSYTHIGSPGNPGLAEIVNEAAKRYMSFNTVTPKELAMMLRRNRQGDQPLQ